MLKVSLVGCGGIAQVHAQVINDNKDVEFISCCDTNLDRALDIQKKYGAKAFGSISDMLEHEKPDIIHVCTPHYTHAPISTYALNNNINVLLEKPAVSNPCEIMALKIAEQNSKAQLGICFQNRYNKSSLFAKELITSGKAGKIIGARCFVTWKREKPYYADNDWRGSVNTEGASVLINQSIHSLDLINWYLGNYTDVNGSVSNKTLQGIINTEDTADAIINYENGARAIFYATVGYSNDDEILIDLACENCSIRIEGDNLSVFYKDGKTETTNFKTDAETIGKSYWGQSHAYLIEDFYKCVMNNKKFVIDACEGTEALKIAFEIAGKL